MSAGGPAGSRRGAKRALGRRHDVYDLGPLPDRRTSAPLFGRLGPGALASSRRHRTRRRASAFTSSRPISPTSPHYVRRPARSEKFSARSRFSSTTAHDQRHVTSEVTPEHCDDRLAGQSEASVFRSASRAARHDRGQGRRNRQSRFDLVDGRAGRHGGLYRGEVRRARADPVAGASDEASACTNQQHVVDGGGV